MGGGARLVFDGVELASDEPQVEDTSHRFGDPRFGGETELNRHLEVPFAAVFNRRPDLLTFVGVQATR